MPEGFAVVSAADGQWSVTVLGRDRARLHGPESVFHDSYAEITRDRVDAWLPGDWVTTGEYWEEPGRRVWPAATPDAITARAKEEQVQRDRHVAMVPKVRELVHPDGGLRSSPPERRGRHREWPSLEGEPYVSGRDLEQWPGRVATFRRQTWDGLTDDERSWLLVDAYPDQFVEWLPHEPRLGGDVGGDGQVGESWCRRYVQRVEDGLYAVITVYFYYVDEQLRDTGEPGDRLDAKPWQQFEYVLCTDPTAPGSTQEWGDQTDYELDRTSWAELMRAASAAYADLGCPDQYLADSVEHPAKVLCLGFDSDDLEWRGPAPLGVVI